MEGGAWWAAVHGVTTSLTRLSNFTFTFHFHALEKEMATHSSVLAWRIPGTGERGGLPSMGSHRVGHNWSDLAAAAAACLHKGFSGSSVGIRFACSAGDPGSIPQLRRSPGEGIGYPLQYSWASLMAQMAKNPLTMRETWVWFLGWEDPLEEGMATHSSILAWRIPMAEEPDGLQCMGHKELDMTEWLNTAQHIFTWNGLNFFYI